MMISLSSLILLAASFLCALAASWVLLVPFFQDEASVLLGTDQVTQHHRELVARKERAMDALEDLELDRISGKVPGELYNTLKTELTDEAAVSLSKLDSE